MLVHNWPWFHRDDGFWGWRAVASISVKSELGRVRLMYRNKSYGDGWEDLDYPVRISSTPCHYGGHRYWFICPAQGCGRRVAKLYSGRIFACRHCYQLAYPSQREASFERCRRRADKIRERLGWADDPDLMEGIKPKGMHWQTYHRLVAELDQWDRKSDGGFASYISQRLGQLKPLQ